MPKKPTGNIAPQISDNYDSAAPVSDLQYAGRIYRADERLFNDFVRRDCHGNVALAVRLAVRHLCRSTLQPPRHGLLQRGSPQQLLTRKLRLKLATSETLLHEMRQLLETYDQSASRPAATSTNRHSSTKEIQHD